MYAADPSTTITMYVMSPGWTGCLETGGGRMGNLESLMVFHSFNLDVLEIRFQFGRIKTLFCYIFFGRWTASHATLRD